MTTKQGYISIILLTELFFSSGCLSTRQQDKNMLVEEVPQSGTEYWQQRSDQDRTDQQIDRTRGPESPN